MTHDASHSYTYDAFGRRVKRVAGGNSTEYVYDKDGSVSWDLLNGHVDRTYIRSNGRLVAEYDVTRNATYFVQQDHLGSTRLVTGYPTASVVECDDYYPFGEQISCGGTSTTTHKFTGYERDAESGLDNAQARYNSSSLGRFMSPDPVGNFVADATNPQTWNLYTYVDNNPLTFTDPTGTEKSDRGDATGDEQGDAPGTPHPLPADPTAGAPMGTPADLGALCPAISCTVEMHSDPPVDILTSDDLSLGGGPQSVIGGGGHGGGGATSQLNHCTSSQFAVSTISFTASQAHATGTFTGAKAGIYTGPTTPDRPGPYRFTVINNVFMTLSAVTSSYLMQGGTVAPGQMVGGLTFKSDPFANFTAYNQSPSQIVNTQIFELGNSLAYITHTVPANPNTELGPNNTEPGRKLLVCYQSGGSH